MTSIVARTARFLPCISSMGLGRKKQEKRARMESDMCAEIGKLWQTQKHKAIYNDVFPLTYTPCADLVQKAENGWSNDKLPAL